MTNDRFIRVAPDGWNFTEGKGGPTWYCAGVNYFTIDTGWAPQLWKQMDFEKTRRHFGLLQELGVTAARMFLTWASFFPKRGRLNEEAVEKLRRICQVGREFNIRLNFTGPDHWEGPAEWRPPDADHYTDPQIVEALEEFWTLMGTRVKDEPQIFAWDLLNEPNIDKTSKQLCLRWPKWRERQENAGELPEEYPLKDKQLPPKGPVLLAALRYRAEIAREWVVRQVAALRKADPNHLITCGLLREGVATHYPWVSFEPSLIEDQFDFMSLHYYPGKDVMDSPANMEEYLAEAEIMGRYMHFNKPVIFQEFSWYGTDEPYEQDPTDTYKRLSEEDQARLLGPLAERSRAFVGGWMPWGMLDAPLGEDISKFSGLFRADEKIKKWGRRYKEFLARVKSEGIKRLNLEPKTRVNVRELYVNANNARQMWQGWIERVVKEGAFDFEIEAGFEMRCG